MQYAYVTKIFHFEAAHKLPNYCGDCKNLHGHSYKLEVTVGGNVDITGMVLDFKVLNQVVKDVIIEKFDHKYLNDFIDNPTAENIAQYIFDSLAYSLDTVCNENMGIRLKIVKLWETENSFVLVTD